MQTRAWPFDPASAATLAAAAWEIPFIIGLGYWELLWSAGSLARAPAHREAPAHELVVPPPIEDEGEHALFA